MRFTDEDLADFKETLDDDLEMSLVDKDDGGGFMCQSSKMRALLARLEAAELCVEEYRDRLADMHISPCAFDEPEPKPNDVECMACWAFQSVPEYKAWLKSKGG